MSRIRSIHPSLFTDERYMSMSMPAKAAWPALWTQCDDDGVFEWKPIVLKARIFPADNIDFAPILAEFEELGCVISFERDGRKYGLVRNFVKYQRPKKPNGTGLVPNEYRTFVGLKVDGERPVRNQYGTSSEPVPNQFGSGTEKQCQRKEEGGRREEERKKEEDTAANAAVPASKYFFESGVIRLTKPQFHKWLEAFPHVSLMAELTALTEWAGKQENWFFAVAGALRKRDSENMIKIRAAEAKAKAEIDDGIWKPGVI